MDLETSQNISILSLFHVELHFLTLTFTNFPFFTISLHFKLGSFEENCRESLSKGNPLFSSLRLVDLWSLGVFGFMFL